MGGSLEPGSIRRILTFGLGSFFLVSAAAAGKTTGLTDVINKGGGTKEEL